MFGRLELYVIDPTVSCEECGACCRHLSTPPFLDYEYPFLPAHLLEEINAVIDADIRHDNDGHGCIWFNHDNQKCNHYEHRPDVCAEFLVGGEDCLRFRHEHQKPSALEDNYEG